MPLFLTSFDELNTAQVGETVSTVERSPALRMQCELSASIIVSSRTLCTDCARI